MRRREGDIVETHDRRYIADSHGSLRVDYYYTDAEIAEREAAFAAYQAKMKAEIDAAIEAVVDKHTTLRGDPDNAPATQSV